MQKARKLAVDIGGMLPRLILIIPFLKLLWIGGRVARMAVSPLAMLSSYTCIAYSLSVTRVSYDSEVPSAMRKSMAILWQAKFSPVGIMNWISRGYSTSLTYF